MLSSRRTAAAGRSGNVEFLATVSSGFLRAVSGCVEQFVAHAITNTESASEGRNRLDEAWRSTDVYQLSRPRRLEQRCQVRTTPLVFW